MNNIRILTSTSLFDGHDASINIMRRVLQEKGMVTSGVNPELGLVEIIELPNHPFFIGVQYHPELKSTVEHPAPLFVHFIAAAKVQAAKKA